jgi:hypothetical protein
MWSLADDCADKWLRYGWWTTRFDIECDSGRNGGRSRRGTAYDAAGIG